MGTEEPRTMSSLKPPPYLPPGLTLIRARPRTSKVLGLDCPSPPPRSNAAVPFLWEHAPGKPKQLQQTSFPSPANASPFLPDADDGAEACPAPLKLPPRLQATAAPSECSLSPNTVLQGPYFGRSKRPPRPPLRRSGSTASCRSMLGAGGAIFSWKKTTAATGDHHDASCCSPTASWASSSSSSSMSFFADDHARRQHADGHEDGSVRIRRLRRNRSLPTMATSHLWASIRKSIKQISPWS